VNIMPVNGVGGSGPANLPPEADAGQDQRVRSGETVTLDGSSSIDPDDDIVAYEWKQIGGPSVHLWKSTKEKPTFRAPFVRRSGASLTFRLTVTDRGGLKSSDTCVVDVTGTNRMMRHLWQEENDDDRDVESPGGGEMGGNSLGEAE
jgi:hypothetical protein